MGSRAHILCDCNEQLSPVPPSVISPSRHAIYIPDPYVTSGTWPHMFLSGKKGFTLNFHSLSYCTKHKHMHFRYQGHCWSDRLIVSHSWSTGLWPGLAGPVFAVCFHTWRRRHGFCQVWGYTIFISAPLNTTALFVSSPKNEFPHPPSRSP